MKCPNCSREMSSESKFCDNCGTRLPAPADFTGDIVATGQSTVVKATTVYMGANPPEGRPNHVKCPLCGKYNLPLDTFTCRVCERDYICIRHQHPEWFLCPDCSRAEEKRRAEAARQAEEKSRQDEEKRQAEEKQRREEEQRRRREEIEREQGKVRRQGNEMGITLFPGIEIVLLRIPAGEFLMGSDGKQDKDAISSEMPQHKVFLDEYWMGKYSVTQAQYHAFVEASGYSGKGDFVGGKETHPVTDVSWEDAVAFCDWVSRISKQRVRLPTEAEWEKAARGTDCRIYPWGNEPPDATRCNFNNNVKDTTPVGKYSLRGDSPYGCADIAGNVWEWCADWIDYGYYKQSAGKNPTGPASGQYRVLRGGSFDNGRTYVRCAFRNWYDPNNRYVSLGFRVCLPPI